MKLRIILMILIVLLSLDGFAHEGEKHVTSDSKKIYDVIKTCLSQLEESDTCYIKGCENESKYLCAEKILDFTVLINGPEKAMMVLQDIMASSLFGIKTDGHQLAHVIGRSTSHHLGETGKSFLRCPTDFNYGCQHGFFEKALTEHNEPVKAAESICESLPPAPSKDYFYCYHGVGHGYMFYVNYNLTNALDICDALSTPTAQEGCWQGTFMENVNGKFKGEPIELLGFKKDDPLAPCNALDTKYRHQCYENHAGYLLHYFNTSLEKATNACLNAGDHTISCIRSIGLMTTNPGWQKVLSRSFKGSLIETAVHICDRFPTGYVEECYWAGIDNLINFDALNLERSSEFCMAINITSECFKRIGGNIGHLVVDNDQYEQICNTVPDEFKDDCLGQRGGVLNKDNYTLENKQETSGIDLCEVPNKDNRTYTDQQEETGLIFFIKDSLRKIWILIRASFELIRDELFVSNLTEEKTIDTPDKTLKPEQDSEREEKTIDTPDKTLKPEQDSEQLLYDDDVMDEMIKTYSLRSLTQSLSRLGHAKGVDCHNRAHELGRRAYELLGSTAFKSCGIECHSGCRHGATEAFFSDKGSESLAANIKLLCEDEKGGFGLHQCLHGTGHGLMAWFDYDIHGALKACDLIESQQHRGSCHSGVFMENIVGGLASSSSEKEGYHITKYLNDDPHYPCNVLDDKYKNLCYFLQTDRMLALLGSQRHVGDECAKIPEQFQHNCFFSMGRTISGSVLQEPARSFELCGTIQDIKNRNTCLRGVLADLIWDETHAERAIAFCKLDHHSSFHVQCYDLLINSAAQVIPQNKMKDFCEKLPKQHHDKCNAQKPSSASPLSISNETGVTTEVQKTDNAVIRYVNREYVPSTVHISIGQNVTWINDDQAFWPASNLHPTHTAYPGSNIIKCFTSEKDIIFDACETKGTGETYTFAFNTVGSWRFHDHINPQAAGTIIVSE